MNCARRLGLVAAAAATLVAFGGPDTASASENLCSVTTTPCPSEFPAGTRMDFTLAPGTTAFLKDTSTNTLNTCTGSTEKIELTVPTPATGQITAETWSGCQNQTTMTQLSRISIEHIANTDDGLGRIDDGELKMTVSIPLFGSCVYGMTAGASLGRLTGGKPASLDVNAVMSKLSGSNFVCPETAVESAVYVMTEPAGTSLYVET
jgi:hypothetical protein